MKPLITFCIVLITALYTSKTIKAQPGIITTVAGTGIASFSGDGGMATAATTNHPIGLTIDLAGNVYFAEDGNNRIRKINTSGVISTVAGTGVAGFSGDGGPATAAKINQPYWVDVDAAGNLYIADAFNHRVRKVSTSGIISTIAGTGTSAFGGDGGAATAAQLWYPICVKHDNAGNLYVVDNGNHRVRKISTTGIISTIAGNGVATYSGDGGPAITASLRYPSGVWVDASGNVFIADSDNDRIRKINASGIISTIAGTGVTGYSGDGGPAILAKINKPQDVITDATGNIYIADNLNSRVRKINLSGTITTIVGTGIAGFSGDGGPATAAQLNDVNGIFFNAAGELYIVDVMNHRIRKVSSTVANYPPTFTKGDSASLVICAVESTAPTPIDTFLSALDPDLAQTLVWGVVTPPAHGTLAGSYSAASGITITPSSFTYTPTVGYVGTDMFQMSVTDGAASDMITINVSVNVPPTGGTISGIDTVCPGDTVVYTETVAGGVWSSSTTTVATVSSTGTVTGIAPGLTAITYTVTNVCGTATATHPLYVKPFSECPSFVGNISGSKQMALYPNPSDGHFTVTLYSGTNKEITVSIFDLLGRKVGEFLATANTPTDISVTAPSGIYVLKATDAHTTWTGRLFLKN